jgi:hypothetical protein
MEDYIKLFQQLLNSLSPNCASLKISDEPLTGGLLIEVKPASSKAAKIDAIVESDFGVHLEFGVGAVFDVPLKGKRYTDLPCYDEVKALCTAVIAGEFEEKVLFVETKVLGAVKTKVLGAKARIFLEKPWIEKWRELEFHPGRKKEWKHFKYSPYIDT